MGLLVKYRQVSLEVIGIIFLLFSTYSGQITISYAETDDWKKIKKIGIEEFQIHNSPDNSDVSPIDTGAGTIVADIFYKELSSYKYYDLIAPAEMPFGIEIANTPATPVESSLNQTIKPQPEKDLNNTAEAHVVDLDAIIARVISRYGSTDLDAVVTGVITRYDDKEGSAISADTPASVGFIVYLVSLTDKKIIWSGHFAETQTALFENLLLLERFIEAGGVWLSSGDLAKLVMQRAIKTFPGVNQNNVTLISK